MRSPVYQRIIEMLLKMLLWYMPTSRLKSNVLNLHCVMTKLSLDSMRVCHCRSGKG